MARVFTITEGLENMGALKTGGQGSVYKGRRVGDIITAIKILPTPVYSETGEDKSYVAFRNEVQKLKKVNEHPNPNVVKILGSGITDSGNFPFIEMEYIEGPDLEDLLKPPHPPVFTIKEVLKVALQLSNALSHCHQAGVRHGDVKSNNVKFNNATGNYILLDFGLAVMSDEQRRTSLRLAGAVEFMAPEQSEGEIYFQTDVYSFGVILFELLAGTVPFPLKDKGESARNAVIVAHLETSPPDILTLREQHLPADWNSQVREHELQLPPWLTGMIYRCLSKKPSARFSNGMELHDFIWHNTYHPDGIKVDESGQVAALQQENRSLKRQVEELQKQLKQRTPVASLSASHILPAKLRKGIRKKGILIFLAAIVLTVAVVYVFKKWGTGGGKQVAGSYFVSSPRAYFYNSPVASSRRNGYAVPGKNSLPAYDDKDGFIYTEITNEKGVTSKGWLRKQDLINASETAAGSGEQDSRTKTQLQNARSFLLSGKMVEALTIYSALSKQQVPEAMYYYGKLGLQNKNLNITCGDSFDLLKRAAQAGFNPARRTLGFIYAFADNKKELEQAGLYQRCTFAKNTRQGSQWLMEAMLAGDTTAYKLLDKLQSRQ